MRLLGFELLARGEILPDQGRITRQVGLRIRELRLVLLLLGEQPRPTRPGKGEGR